MSATLRLKQLLFIATALALVALGLVATISTASPARADDTAPCVPKDAYTETVHHDAVTHVVHHDAVTHVVHHDAVPGPWWNWAPNDNRGPFEGTPLFPSDDRGTWEGPHTVGGPSQDLTGTFQQGEGNAPWFHREAGQSAYDETVVDQEAYDETVVDQEAYDETIEHPAVTCPDPGPDCEADPTAEGCPPVDEGKKVVVCKYVGAPPGTPDHIIVVSVNSLDNFPENPVFPLTFGDAQDSIAIRFAVGNEQPGDEELVNCPVEEEPEVCPEGTDNAGQEIPEGETEETFCNDEEEPEVCPEGTDNAGQEIPQGETEETFCDEEPNPGPETCPVDTDKAGQEIPEGDTAEEFCDDDDEENVCPEDADHAGQEIPQGDTEEEFCDDDDVDPGPNCEEDPTQPGCDEDNPPVIVPDDGTTPNSPSNGPTVKGAQATAPTAVAGAVAGTPAARVPTAVDAGLAPAQRDGTGGGLGLLGIAAALLGAALVGSSFRPRRRDVR